MPGRITLDDILSSGDDSIYNITTHAPGTAPAPVFRQEDAGAARNILTDAALRNAPLLSCESKKGGHIGRCRAL